MQGVRQGQKYNKLYASNFTAYTNDLQTTDGSCRGDAEIDSLQVTTMLAYKKKDFNKAETDLNQILIENYNPDIRFYLAITQLETGKNKRSLENSAIALCPT